jgi:hypothetical protein
MNDDEIKSILNSYDLSDDEKLEQLQELGLDLEDILEILLVVK